MYYRYIFDLDNTLADFDGAGGFERMYEKGFFENLTPYPRGLEMVKALHDIEAAEIFILSACIPSEFCRDEKRAWIAKHLPFIKESNIILMDVGKNKAIEFMRATETTIEEEDFLFDDYGKNLQAWYEMGGTPIKCGKTYKKNRKFKQLIEFRDIHKVFA